jgi:hypothetical protein
MVSMSTLSCPLVDQCTDTFHVPHELSFNTGVGPVRHGVH